MNPNNELRNSQEWSDCLRYMSRRLKEQSFSTWLKTTKGLPGENGDFTVFVPNQFVADWIKEHFQVLIDEAMTEVLGKTYQLSYSVTSPNQRDEQVSIDFGRPTEPPNYTYGTGPSNGNGHEHNLNDKYTFDSLVVGDFNDFACTASRVVADNPRNTSYNPFYVYGGTGLGKTHIIQAIGNRIRANDPKKRIMYATSEKFTSDFINSISDGSVSDFTRKYRAVDVLIVDDIQFFAGKESTQEQFFHTFNALYHLGKQIVLSSDRSPRDIKGLEERLLSRFAMGLVTDIQVPDFENRMAILYKKLESEKSTLPHEVIAYIADKVNTNIRDLEGALIRLLAYAYLKKVTVDLELAKRVLDQTLQTRRKQVNIDAVKKVVSKDFEVPVEIMVAKKKTAKVALARQVAMYLCRALTDIPLKAIGEAFGGRDHSTVIHACEMINKRITLDAGFRERVDRLSSTIIY